MFKLIKFFPFKREVPRCKKSVSSIEFLRKKILFSIDLLKLLPFPRYYPDFTGFIFSMFCMKFLPVPLQQILSIPYDNFFCRMIVFSKTGAGGSPLSTFFGGIIQCSSRALYSYLSLSYLSTFIWNRLLILITVTHRETLFIFDI